MVTSVSIFLLVVAWAVWLWPFVRARRRQHTAVVIDRRARSGIALQTIAYLLLAASPATGWHPTAGRLFVAAAVFASACALAYTALRVLGRHWRVDAGLNADHHLVRAGPYRVVRHPVYLSMLGMLIGMGTVLAPPWTLVVAILLFLLGTEVRIRREDALLESSFGDTFRTYRASVPAYLPLVR